MSWIGVTVGGLAGIVGAILALKDGKVGIPLTFSSHNSSSDQSLFVPGLQNLQNNCFLNVVLQVKNFRCCFLSFFNPQMIFYARILQKNIFLLLFLSCRL